MSRDIMSIKYFNGVGFSLADVFRAKQYAQESAKENRARGIRTRVIDNKAKSMDPAFNPLRYEVWVSVRDWARWERGG